MSQDLQEAVAGQKLPAWMTYTGTLLGAGFSPKAPGTVGSAVALLVPLLLPASVYPWLLPVLLVAALLIGRPIADRFAEAAGAEDPQHFVLDEAGGLWLACLRFAKPEWSILILCFVLFRIFDIWKPWPVRQLEALHGGLGVMADDLAAGVYALVLSLAAQYWLFPMLGW